MKKIINLAIALGMSMSVAHCSVEACVEQFSSLNLEARNIESEALKLAQDYKLKEYVESHVAERLQLALQYGLIENNPFYNHLEDLIWIMDRIPAKEMDHVLTLTKSFLSSGWMPKENYIWGIETLIKDIIEVQVENRDIVSSLVKELIKDKLIDPVCLNKAVNKVLGKNPENMIEITRQYVDIIPRDRLPEFIETIGNTSTENRSNVAIKLIISFLADCALNSVFDQLGKNS